MNYIIGLRAPTLILFILILVYFLILKKNNEHFQIIPEEQGIGNQYWEKDKLDPSGSIDYMSWDKKTTDAICIEDEYDLYSPDDDSCFPRDPTNITKSYGTRYSKTYDKLDEQPWFDNNNARQNFYPELFYIPYEKDGIKKTLDKDITITPRNGKGKTCLNKKKTLIDSLPSTQRIQCKQPNHCEYKTKLGGSNYTASRPVEFEKVSGTCDGIDIQTNYNNFKSTQASISSSLTSRLTMLRTL